MKNSKMMTVSKRDALKSIILLFITGLVMGLYNVLVTGEFPLTWGQWQPILATSVAAAIAYIIKNFLTTSDDKFLGKETT